MQATRTSLSIRHLALIAAAGILAVGALSLSPVVRAGTAHSVQIVDFAYAPATLTITAGDTVTWTNLDAAVHTATSTTGAFDSSDLDQGESFSLTFTTPGAYDYLCSPHPFMTGRIVVEAAAGTQAPAATPAATTSPTGELPNVAMTPPNIVGMAAVLLGSALLLAAIRSGVHRVVRRGEAL